MPRIPWLCLLLAMWAAPLSAQQPDPVEGSYQSETMEVGSVLVLAPDGRFLWMFAYGALDLSGEGRWSRAADGAILLNSDPGIVEPRFELVGRSRDEQPGVEVRLACDTGDAQYFLNVLTEHANGERILHRFQNLAFRTYGEPPSVVTAVQLGSESFDLLSDRYPVDPDEANVLTFHFIPNDLGRHVFRDERVTIADGVATLNLRGMPIRYRRQASAAGADLPRLPPGPRADADATAAVAVELGEPFEALQARAGANLTGPPGEGLLMARAPVDLRLTYNGRDIDLGRVEAGSRPLIVGSESGQGVVDSLRFGHQVAPLTLDEALARAQALKAWLEQAGFVAMPGADALDRPDFAVDGENVGEAQMLATDWASAASVLADEARGVTEMNLYVRRTSDYRAMVRLENSRRRERDTCRHSDWPAGGRDWRLLVDISYSLAPAPEAAQE